MISAAQSPPVLLKTLPPVRETAYFSEYVDVEKERPGQSARIYIFWRDPAQDWAESNLLVRDPLLFGEP
jgi:hypothetical protein